MDDVKPSVKPSFPMTMSRLTSHDFSAGHQVSKTDYAGVRNINNYSLKRHRLSCCFP